MPSGKTPASLPQGSKSAKARPGASRTAAGKVRPAATGKRKTTPGGLLTIAILGGLAIGLVGMVMYSVFGPQSEWAFDRPEAHLPSLQTKHTLQ